MAEISHIYLFEEIPAEMLFQLDTRKHTDTAHAEGHFSEDEFQYVRATVVASGPEKYRQVVQHLTTISGNEEKPKGNNSM